MLCHYCYFKEFAFKFEPHVCNRMFDILMTAAELNIAILDVKGLDSRCFYRVLETVKILNDFALEDKSVL